MRVVCWLHGSQPAFNVRLHRVSAELYMPIPKYVCFFLCCSFHDCADTICVPPVLCGKCFGNRLTVPCSRV